MGTWRSLSYKRSGIRGMAMVKRIACFLTCGYTEAGTMQAFLKKINENYEYKQYLPNRTIKKKGSPKNISSSISGLTGEKLLEKVYDIIEKHKDDILKCSAIIIEDDLDDRFSGFTESEIQTYIDNIKHNIYDILGCEKKVFILYASPEIESWFVSDWENGFQYLFCDSGIVKDVQRAAIRFYTHNLKLIVEKNILKQYVNNIEKYGIFNGRYIKLSDKLIEIIQFDSKTMIANIKGANAKYIQQIIDSRYIYYSKKLHGGIMLRNIRPEIVANNCRCYFKNTYLALRDFDEKDEI